MRSAWLRRALLTGLCLACPVSLFATNVCGSYTTNQTWTTAGSPYILTCSVTIGGPAAPVLTINAGVTVKVGAGSSLLISDGNAGGISVQGTSAQHVTFTASTGTTSGYWDSIQLNTLATSTSSITYADVFYSTRGIIFAGSGSPTFSNVKIQYASLTAFTVQSGSPTISAATLTNNQWGLAVTGGTPTINGSSAISSNTNGGATVSVPASPSFQTVTFASNLGYALSQDAGVTFGTMSGLTVTGNTTDAVEMRGTQIATATTWKSFGVPYVATNWVSVGGTASPVLTIQAGVTVKFTSGGTLMVANGGAGGINVQGTTAQHVTFTSSTGTTPGYWDSIQLFASTTASSSMTYADVLYSARGIIFAGSGSPTFSNVKVQNASQTGFTVQSGSPTISAATLTNNKWGLAVTGGTPTINGSSAISSNTQGGATVSVPAAPSFQTVTFASNVGYPLSQDAGVTFGTMSGVTVSGNTTDAVEMRGTTITANTTWKNFSVPYVATNWVSVGSAATPVLTIQAGVTVKFTSGGALLIANGGAGGIAAIGTAAQPITFTANTQSPVAGYWWGLQVYAGTTAGSSIRYASVSYASGIQVAGSSPTIDHVTLNVNNTAGITTNNAAPSIRNCNFAGNAAGVLNQTPAVVVDARLNWWNSATGPSGSGPGAGQSVSAGVLFEPWLTAAGSSPQYITAFSLANSTFNPNIGINANFSFTTTQSGNWTLTITNSLSQLVRTFTGTGATGSPSWDGKDGSNNLQQNGVYTYKLTSVAGANSASPPSGRVTLDTTKQLTLTGVVLAPAFFSPNADGVQDTTTLSSVSSFDGASWTLSIKNSGGTVVRSASGSGSSNISYVWDGKNAAVPPVVQLDGVYTFLLTVTDGSASTNASPTVALDKTLPVATLTAPANGATLSNVYQSGASTVTITGTSTDTNLATWTVDYGAGAAPTSWTSIANGTTPVSNSTLGTWSTISIVNGQYTIRLLVIDKAGNQSSTSRTITLGNFNVAGGSQPLNPASSGTANFTSVVPFTLTETFVIKNSLGQIVKTVFSGTRNAGSYADTWNGKNAQNVFVPAGTYTALVTVTAGASNMTWNPPPATINDSTPLGSYFHWTWSQTFWPFNNRTLQLTYTIPAYVPLRPARVWILFTPDPLSVWFNGQAKLSMCSTPGNFCNPAGLFQQPGTYTIPWPGIDLTRTLRPDVDAVVFMWTYELADGNIIQVGGSEPVISGLTLTPSYFRPGVGNMQLALNVASFQNSALTVVATIERLDVAGPMKTITAASQPAGLITLQWDGRSDTGYMLAEGYYLVTVTVTDALGSTASQQAVFTIAY